MPYAVAALWRREIIKFVRDRSRIVGALAQPLGFWVLLGLGFQGTFRLPAAGEAGMSYLEYLFPGILTLILLFTAIFSTISVVEERKSGFLQAALVSPVSRTTLVLGNTLGGTTLAVAESALFLLFLPTLNLSPSLTGLALILAIAFLTGLGFTALGVTIAWRMQTTRGFHAVMNMFLLPLWFLSGAFFPKEGAPVLLQWLIQINPVSYAVNALRQGLYWPDPSPLALASTGASLAVTLAFAGLMLALAVRTVQRPLFES